MGDEKYLVLIVDDDRQVCNAMKNFLESALPVNVLASLNADEGLILAQTHKPDIIISDVVMPGHNGIWLMEQIRKMDKNTILILVSAYYKEDEMSDIPGLIYIPKPFDYNLLKSIILNCIENVKLKKELNALISLVIKNGF